MKPVSVVSLADRASSGSTMRILAGNAPQESSPYCRAQPSAKSVNQEDVQRMTGHCIPCPANTYSVGGSNECLPCKNDEGAPSLSSRCYSCLPGTQFAPDGYTCNACPAGSERAHTSKECSPCKPGMVSPSESTAYCEPCPAGTYSNANATGCIECPEGFYCTQAVTEPEKCIGSSSYCPRGSSAPIVTMAGMYTNVARTSIKNCEPGYYCINGKKMPCPKNTYGASANLTSASCDGPCVEDLFQYSNASATKCSCLPSFINVGVSKLECTCPAQMYLSSLGTCVECPPGTAKPGTGTGYHECKAEDMSTSAIILGTMVVIALSASGILFATYRRTGNISMTFGVLFNPLMLTLFSLGLDVVDIGSDGITCYNVLQTTDATVERFHLAYRTILFFSSIGSIIAFTVRIKAVRFFWHNRKFEEREGGRMNIVRDFSQRIVPIVDGEMVTDLTREKRSRR